MHSATLVTTIFAAALCAGLICKYWLASRQIRHVSRHRSAVPSPFVDAIALTAHQKAADYTVAKTRLGLLELTWGAAVLLGWTLLGGLDRLNQVLLSLLGTGMAQQLALIACFALIGGLLDLPFTLHRTFVLEERFGFNKLTWRLWLSDSLKALAVAAIIGLPIAGLVLWLMSAAGATWWLWAWVAWVGFNLLLMVVYPTFIAPLFNAFKPMTDESLKERVTALMRRCGFAAKGLFVMDGSRRSAHANAYFTGFGAAKRVVFYDTLLEQLDADEVEAVLAHELGHFRHRHIIKRLVLVFGGSFLGFALLGWLSTQPWFYSGLGVQPNLALGAPNDALALLLFLSAMPVLGFFLAPVAAWASRRDEFEADAYAVTQTSAADLSSALLKLYKDNASTLTPDPWFVRFYYSHPPAAERLARMDASPSLPHSRKRLHPS
ncbi:MAG: M48 family peptidase [Comamonadaceae bacterium]|nr:MAG: M48 family peptidase [Comamonadaceae bacterium]